MIKIAEQGTKCKIISKWWFSNFTASPLTEKSRHGYIEDKVYFLTFIIWYFFLSFSVNLLGHLILKVEKIMYEGRSIMIPHFLSSVLQHL
jgi:hypothetical protein